MLVVMRDVLVQDQLGCREDPTHVAAAERQMADQEARRFGLDTTDITAGEALIREVRRSAAMVDFLAVLVAGLDLDDLTWGIASRRITPASTPGGTPTVQVEQRARLHPLVVMLRDERVLLGRLAESAHRCGIEERMMRQVEVDGAMIAKVIKAILGDPELALQPHQWAQVSKVVPRHLRAMDSAA